MSVRITFIWICGTEPLQSLPYRSILRHICLNIGSLEDRLVVIDIPELDDDPGVGHVVLVVVRVLALVVHLNPKQILLSLYSHVIHVNSKDGAIHK